MFNCLVLAVFSGQRLCAQSPPKDVSVTVYNDNLALVREVREVELPPRRSEIEIKDVAALIDPTSVYFNSLTAPDKVTILEQNYEYDLINSNKILAKYLDQEISLKLKGDVSYSGILLSASGSDLVLREEDESLKIVSQGNVEHISFPALPHGLITRPTLIWQLDCKKAGKHQAEIGYLTSGMNWHAEYVCITNEEDTRLDVGAWVSVDNQSGVSYENARLKLVAGDVNRARDVQPLLFRKHQMQEMALSAEGFQEKAFFEYHLYTLERRSTLANNQTKQISLFPSSSVPVAKHYVLQSSDGSGKVKVNLEFANKESSGLGVALPKGKARIYKQDSDGSLVLIGEDFIEHTPKDEKVTLFVGHAFDIVAERTQKERRSVGKEAWEEAWEIKLRNHKKEAVTVRVVEALNARNWELLRNSHPYTQKDANTVDFKVKVAKDSEAVLTYLVRYNP